MPKFCEVPYGFVIMLQRDEKKIPRSHRRSHAIGTKLLGVGEFGDRGMRKIEEDALR